MDVFQATSYHRAIMIVGDTSSGAPHATSFSAPHVGDLSSNAPHLKYQSTGTIVSHA